ncbi:MAG: hypothetical protein P9X22_04080 [Candidatus Zapsychrus exili]|nr:hypothetical protein [Candidatus Zapsychrus exili]
MDFIKATIFIIFLSPVVYMSHLYPEGGWDAWTVWNFKSKTLLLGSENWQNIFDPVLWRTSPHYPLFLPFINVWGWSFTKNAPQITPILTSIIFSIMLIGLLFSTIKELVRTDSYLIPVISVLSLPVFIKLSTSQYSDLLVGFYLLAIFYCLIIVKLKNCKNIALLAGIFIGFLSFTKSEGFVTSAIILLLFLPFIFFKNTIKDRKQVITYFFLAAAISLIPAIIFKVFYAPENLTFINGLISAKHPASFERLQAILFFYCIEPVTFKWNGFWIVLFLSMLLSLKKCFDSNFIIIPCFLFIYFLILTAYYLTNTHFAIAWWLKNTLTRILFSVLPSIVLWVNLCVFDKQE